MAQAGEWNEQVAVQQQPRGMFIGTPEIYFAKRIDNSRVVIVTDPKRRREMVTFGIMLGVLFCSSWSTCGSISARSSMDTRSNS